MDSVDWHSDDESLFHSKYEDCLVISLSLGESRKFEMKLLDDDFTVDNNTNNVPETKTTQIILRHGDLMTMEGLFQKYYIHRVPKSILAEKPRINLTWRWIKEHYFYEDRCRLYSQRGPGDVKPL